MRWIYALLRLFGDFQAASRGHWSAGQALRSTRRAPRPVEMAAMNCGNCGLLFLKPRERRGRCDSS